MHWKGYEESLDLTYITPLSRWHGLGPRKVFPGPWFISKVKETASSDTWFPSCAGHLQRIPFSFTRWEYYMEISMIYRIGSSRENSREKSWRTWKWHRPSLPVDSIKKPAHSGCEHLYYWTWLIHTNIYTHLVASSWPWLEWVSAGFQWAHRKLANLYARESPQTWMLGSRVRK